mmetsp:Transcript_4199/g.6369  ORF Transcript_4199/g.6369 Transcript_4199/m.6369 type:complete len:283 (-) Transcript_4199:64-912(-)|eukprot:CAMPEP_0195303054 /NCGR_PEP_ID=MMETSP0707-20130614/32164_1 /TAXON_ID=33640 /ORGANISM="Asterionellopsis glacialis, Strain CCMP134" /LENGTH=282 /DNA_ID=CAMNT_0040366489 /DNA_START=279 /DNA_END=1127 /DNA_ORIENTATION=+
MLAADKLQLQSALKQQATALKEKEFNLHHSNLMTVGTQAAVLAGLDITMFIEFQPPPNSDWGVGLETIARGIKFIYYITIVAAFCANMMVVSHTTALSVLGAGMALRGPDGSMMTATDGLYDERRSVFYVFGVGLACTVGSVVLCVWLILSWEAALVCMGVTILTCRRIYNNYTRVVDRFDFDENETVDFTDIFEGPAAIRAVNVPFRDVLRRKNSAAAGSTYELPNRPNTTPGLMDARITNRISSDSDEEIQERYDARGTRRRPGMNGSPSASRSAGLVTV